MYKTVRHGENSLQYKILAQQEEGLTNVKCKRSTRALTAKFITVVVLLVCGVIASAVLVPMILTNDFVSLTGTFQKFSVSTLRRSHSGNHVVVIAKKPFGWNASRSSVLQAFKSSNGSQNHDLETKKVSVEIQTVRPSKVHSTSFSRMDAGRATTKQSASEGSDPSDPAKTGGKGPSGKSSSSDSLYQKRRGFQAENPSSTLEPFRQSPNNQKRNFEAPATFANWLKNGVFSSPLSIAGGILFSVVFIVILTLILKRSLPRRRTSAEEESADTKEDKAKLLKPSVRGSDEE